MSEELGEVPDALDTIAEIGRDCRRALLQILSPEARHWTKADLAEWLIGAYADATRHSHFSLPRVSSQWQEARPSSRPVSMQHVHHVIAEACEAAVETLLDSVRGGADFAIAAVEAGHVVHVRDADGEYGFAPVDCGPMRLEARILSLLAADFLSRPEDYELRMRLCPDCGGLTFDCGESACDEHAPKSGVRAHSDVHAVRFPTLPAAAG